MLAVLADSCEKTVRTGSLWPRSRFGPANWPHSFIIVTPDVIRNDLVIPKCDRELPEQADWDFAFGKGAKAFSGIQRPARVTWDAWKWGLPFLREAARVLAESSKSSPSAHRAEEGRKIDNHLPPLKDFGARTCTDVLHPLIRGVAANCGCRLLSTAKPFNGFQWALCAARLG